MPRKTCHPVIFAFLLLIAGAGILSANVYGAGYDAELLARDASGSISGACFADANKNSSMDAGETGIPDLTIVLKRLFPFQKEKQQAATDAQGQYLFPGLQRGLYVLEMQNTGGASCSARNPRLVLLGLINTKKFNFACTVSNALP